ncbi:MAG: DEAD/DEAH box helicase, partial [Xanthobacteraceae bacterium]
QPAVSEAQQQPAALHYRHPEERRHPHRPAARSDEARSRRPPPPRPRHEEAEDSHLPAFLLRPVTVKA